VEGQPPQGIELRIRGPAKDVETIKKQSRLIFPLDLSAITLGVHTLTVDSGAIHLPGRVKVKTFHPETVTLKIVPEVRKEVPIRVSYEGTPARGFYLTDATVSPDTVILHGPSSSLAEMVSVSTTSIDVAQATTDIVKQVSLNLPPDVGVQNKEKPLIATVAIESRTVTRQFRDIPVEGHGTNYSFTIQPTRISLEIQGPSSLLENRNGIDQIKVFVDLKGLAPGVYVRRASISLPLEATLVGEVDPELFTVQIGEGIRNDS
jgi:YbbR domain-containing protein